MRRAITETVLVPVVICSATLVAAPVGAKVAHAAASATTSPVGGFRAGAAIAVEVLDQEGVFDVYQQRIRQKVAADGQGGHHWLDVFPELGGAPRV